LKYYLVYLNIFFWTFCACTASEPLPKVGPTSIENGDTIYHTIAPFEFVNQNNEPINNQKLKDDIYIADFFYTSCPTICPRVRMEMLKIYDTFESHPNVKLVSHTLDPNYDTVEILSQYATDLEVKASKWHFLTGDKEKLNDMAASYFVATFENDSIPGGIEHSGKMLLIDKSGHIRAFSEGTDPSATKGFIKKIKQLLKEYE